MIQRSLRDALYRLSLDLAAIRVRWCLVGGLAVSVHAEPRTTRDLDVVIAVLDDTEAEAVIRMLTNRGYRILREMDQKDRHRLAGMTLVVPGEHGELVTDLLFAMTGIEGEIAAAAELWEVLPGLRVPLATVGHLLAMKVLSLNRDNPQKRGQDLTDIRELLAVASTEDLLQARNALDLMSRRRYDQGKDLMADLEEQLHNFQRGGDSGFHG